MSKEKVADVQLFTKQTDTKIDGKPRSLINHKEEGDQDWMSDLAN